jgi:hypothetical protein
LQAIVLVCVKAVHATYLDRDREMANVFFGLLDKISSLG